MNSKIYKEIANDCKNYEKSLKYLVTYGGRTGPVNLRYLLGQISKKHLKLNLNKMFFLFFHK